MSVSIRHGSKPPLGRLGRLGRLDRLGHLGTVAASFGSVDLPPDLQPDVHKRL